MKQRPKIKYVGKDLYTSYTKTSDDESDMINLPVRKPIKTQQVEVDVQNGDTLQAIALRFNCSVASLKSANNIHKDNEIFAKGKLKIPINAFSLVTETLPLVHTSGSNSPTKLKELTNNVDKNTITDDIDLQQKLIVASVNAVELSGSSRIYTDNNQTVLDNKSQYDNKYIINDNSDSEYHQNDASVPLIANTNPDTSLENVVLQEFTKGADFGIKWCHLVIFALFLVFIVPIIYVLYIAEHPEQYLHHHK